jgi:multiple antibiotic resistance protein
MDISFLDFAQIFKLMVGVTAVVNPIGAIPLFLSLTETETPEERRSTGTFASLGVTTVLAFSVVMGAPLLKMMGIGIPSFRVAGGILILIMALNMLKDGQSDHKSNPQDAADARKRESIAIVPLAIPLMAGPGAISTVIVFSQQANRPAEYVSLFLAVFAVGFLCWIALQLAPFLAKILGPVGMRVMTRIMGLLLAAIGVEFITMGLEASFEVLKRTT